MSMRILLSIMTIVIVLTTVGLSVNYDDLVKQGYRWINIDGPYACVAKDDVRRITQNSSDALRLKMVQEIRAYFLVEGVLVQVIQEDPASAMSQIRMPGITTDLWTLTKFLSKKPIKDIIGRIETPETFNQAPAPNGSPTATPTALPDESPTSTPGQ